LSRDTAPDVKTIKSDVLRNHADEQTDRQTDKLPLCTMHHLIIGSAADGALIIILPASDMRGGMAYIVSRKWCHFVFD